MDINVQEIAQQLINEINKEIKDSEQKVTIGKGAVHGVTELYNRLQQAQQQAAVTNEQNSKPISKKKTKKVKR